jgi:hypothetical protein
LIKIVFTGLSAGFGYPTRAEPQNPTLLIRFGVLII